MEAMFNIKMINKQKRWIKEENCCVFCPMPLLSPLQVMVLSNSALHHLLIPFLKALNRSALTRPETEVRRPDLARIQGQVSPRLYLNQNFCPNMYL